MHTATNHRRSAILLIAWTTLIVVPAKAMVFQDNGQKTATPSASAAPKVIPPEQLKEDFHILRQALEEGHPGIYRYTPKPEMDKRFEDAEKLLDKPMTAQEFFRIVAPVVAALKCGHTGVRMNPDKNKKQLPLVVRVLDRKPFVLRDLSSADGALAGQEIRAINGMAADKIVQTMLAAVSGDGNVQTSRMRRISGSDFCATLIDILGLESPYTVTLWDPKLKHEHTVKLEGIESGKLQDPRRNRSADSATLTFFDDGKIADLKIYGFGGRAGKKDLKGFIKDTFAEIAKKQSRVLILDLRDNGGGADELGKLVLSFLIDEPFQYYDDLVLNGLDFSFRKYSAQNRTLPAGMMERQPNGKYRMVKHPNWGTQQPSKPTFTGKVFILINGVSFSTTSEFLSHAHSRKRATFIGEESGGGYYGNTSGPGYRLTLPNTKLQAYVPLMTYYMAVRKDQPPDHGVLPDVPVSYTIEELIEGKDKELAIALQMARQP
jgi:C-terminal processing protease CtpA/Prc